jgi:4'-phosphopantetheinyl transferase
MADLQDWISNTEQFYNLLSGAEIERLERYLSKDKRSEFLISRGLLRMILAAYLDGDPAKLEIHISQDGKPWVDQAGMSFNISHSGKILLIACGTSGNIGVDIQEIYQISSLTRIIERFFSPAEKNYLAGADTLSESFFELWTAKEAYLKALGAGFQSSPPEISLLPDPSHPGSYTVTGPPSAGQRWSVRTLEVGVGFKAAAAAVGQIKGITLLPLSPDQDQGKSAGQLP